MRKYKWPAMGMALLISISTVFIKQHSILDVAAGLALSTIAWLAVYLIPQYVKKRQPAQVSQSS